MFDKSFEYRLIQKRKSNEYGVLNEHIYDFNSTKRRYIVLVEEYDHLVFVPKFYPSAYRDSPNRFNIILNDFEAARIIRTCINITLDLLKANPEASFAFMGASTKSTNKTETKVLTQRFIIYRKLMLNFFNKSLWMHFDDIDTSTYLLIPFNKIDKAEYTRKVIQMFVDIYPDLDNVVFP